MAYGKSKDLTKRTQLDNVLRDKAFKIVNDPKYDGYQIGLASMVYKFFDKNSSGSGMDQIINWQMSSINQLFENLRTEKFLQLLETIFGALI